MPLFEFRLRVRYGECDAQGVVFNARYGDYVDIAVNEYIRSLFGSYRELLARDLDMQVVGLNQSWRSPAHYDDVLCARISPGHVGRTSFSLHIAFVEYYDQRAVAEADITYVMITPSQGSKVPIPDDIRTLLEQGVPDRMISHAGEP